MPQSGDIDDNVDMKPVGADESLGWSQARPETMLKMLVRALYGHLGRKQLPSRSSTGLQQQDDTTCSFLLSKMPESSQPSLGSLGLTLPYKFAAKRLTRVRADSGESKVG